MKDPARSVKLKPVGQ